MAPAAVNGRVNLPFIYQAPDKQLGQMTQNKDYYMSSRVDKAGGRVYVLAKSGKEIATAASPRGIALRLDEEISKKETDENLDVP
jgi:hypothetical protein